MGSQMAAEWDNGWLLDQIHGWTLDGLSDLADFLGNQTFSTVTTGRSSLMDRCDFVPDVRSYLYVSVYVSL